jgi:hypothetical protein
MGERELREEPERGAPPTAGGAPPTPNPILHYSRVGKDEGRKVRQRNFLFAADVHAILDSLPDRTRTAWVESAIRAKAALDLQPRAILEAELHQVQQQEEALRAKRALIQQRLSLIDDDAARRNDLRRAVERRLKGARWRAHDRGCVAGWKKWAEGRWPWPEVEAVLEAISHA